MKILVVDDERSVRRFLKAALSNQYTFFEAVNGQEALQSAAVNRPDVIMLDLGLPDLDGIEVIRQLREWTDVPIIVISVRDNEEAKIAALDAGADDYLSKPFSVNELLARMRVALRHFHQAVNEPMIYQDDDLLVDLVKREVRVHGTPVMLTPTEYGILRVFVRHAGKVLTHHQLSQEVWGADFSVDVHLLRVNISNLRRKIESDPLTPRHITTEPGVGYRLRENEKIHEQQSIS